MWHFALLSSKYWSSDFAKREAAMCKALGFMAVRLFGVSFLNK
jgi:hypothetical protein